MLNDALDEELRVETPWTLAGLNPNVAYQNVAFRKGDLACIDAPQEVTVNDGDVQRSATVVETPLVSLLERKRDNRKWRSIAVLVGARLAIDWGPESKPFWLFNTLQMVARSNDYGVDSFAGEWLRDHALKRSPYANIDRDASDNFIDIYRYAIDLDFNSPAVLGTRDTWNPPAEFLNKGYCANAEDGSASQNSDKIRSRGRVRTHQKITDGLEKRDRDIQPDRKRPGADCLDLNLRRRVLTVDDSIDRFDNIAEGE